MPRPPCPARPAPRGGVAAGPPRPPRTPRRRCGGPSFFPAGLTTAGRFAELKADKDGSKEYQDIIDTLNRRKVDLQKRIKKNHEWCDNFDKQIGGVQDKYDHFLDDMVVLYDNAVKKHAMGIQYLMDHFNYHPLFKHWDDDFTAVPFRPKSKDKA